MKLCLINEATVDQVQRRIPAWTKKYFGGDQSQASEIIPDVIAADPTNGKYSEWLIRQWRNKTARFPEDTEKLSKNLQLFDQKKSKLEEKDINRYIPSDLAKALEQQLGLTGSERRSARKGKMQLPPGAKFLGKSQGFSVVKITSPEASSLLCSGTEWCVANKDTAEHYLKTGPLFLFYENGEREYLVHIEEGQYMDVYDSPVDSSIEHRLKDAIVDLDSSPSALRLMGDVYGTKFDVDKLVSMVPDVIKQFAENPTPRGFLSLKSQFRNIMSKLARWETLDFEFEDDARKLETIAGAPDKLLEILLKAIEGGADYDVDSMALLAGEVKNPIINDWFAANADFSELFNHYYNSMMHDRWKPLEIAAAELAEQGYYNQVFQRMLEYAGQHKVRIPWVEDHILSGNVRYDRFPNAVATYAIEAIGSRWPEAEPIISQDDTALSRYKYYLGLD